jgi:hypothetical protein
MPDVLRALQTFMGRQMTPGEAAQLNRMLSQVSARQDPFLQANAPVPTLRNPSGLPQNWVGEPNPNIPPPRAPGTLPPVLRPDLPAAPPAGNAPYQPTNEPIGFNTPLLNDRQAYTPPPMMPTQDYYSRPFSNLGFGGMGAYY